MPNESLIAVPVDVAEPFVLKRFLTRLIEELDIVLGYRGGDPYLRSSDIKSVEQGLEGTTTTLNGLDRAISETDATVSQLVEDVTVLDDRLTNDESALSDLTGLVLASTTLDSTYYNFDHANYATLQGRFEFNTVGSNLTNAPFTPVGTTTYFCFFNCATTVGGGVVQELFVYDSTGVLGPTKYARFGDTWTVAKTNGFV